MRKRNVRGICAFLCTILLGCLIPAGEVQAQRALDVARERGYQLEERNGISLQVRSLRRSIPDKFYGRKMHRNSGRRQV